MTTPTQTQSAAVATQTASWKITYPQCGETRFDNDPPVRECADRLAQLHYDSSEIEFSKDKGGAFYAVKVGRRYKAMVGLIDGKMAILHKGDDGSRTLEVLQ